VLLADASAIGSRFAYHDWLVLVCYFALTTLIGARLAGKQATIRDFFLGGRKLPWWAVSGSIVATEISAVTFIAVPTISFAQGGNLTYLQLAIGAIVARVLIAIYFVPRYYEQEIYSPYEYLGRRIGPGAQRLTTALFMIGAVLGQGARAYVAAFVMSAITGLSLVSSIWVIGAVSICWTLLGGITTVIWTDVLQFIVLMVGAGVALATAVHDVPGGWGEVVSTASAAGKFQLLDARGDVSLPYTIWCGFLATPFLNLAAFGTDQVMAQRIFCCRSQRDAAKALIVSSVGIVVALLMLLVGVALYAYFQHQPFTAEEAALYKSRNTYLLPIFIVRALPVGIKGVVVAAVFASAISTLDSTLAALSQTTVGAFARAYGRSRRSTGHGFLGKLLRTEIGLSKTLVVFWGVGLCLMAMACIVIARQHENAVNLALDLVGYTYGQLLGIFLLAFLPLKRDYRGLLWSVPLSMLAVFGLRQHGLEVDLPGSLPCVDVADWIVWIGCAAFLAAALLRSRGDPTRVGVLVAGVLLTLYLHHASWGAYADGSPKYAAFTWSYPVGTAMTLGLGYLLGQSRRAQRAR